MRTRIVARCASRFFEDLFDLALNEPLPTDWLLDYGTTIANAESWSRKLTLQPTTASLVASDVEAKNTDSDVIVEIDLDAARPLGN